MIQNRQPTCLCRSKYEKKRVVTMILMTTIIMMIMMVEDDYDDDDEDDAGNHDEEHHMSFGPTHPPGRRRDVDWHEPQRRNTPPNTCQHSKCKIPYFFFFMYFLSFKFCISENTTFEPQCHNTPPNTWQHSKRSRI